MEAYNSIENNETLCNVMFSNLPIGIMMLDKNRVVLESNKYMSEHFTFDALNTNGKRFGNYVQCAHATKGNFVCGSGIPCIECSIRRSIEQLFKTKEDIVEQEIKHHFVINGRESEKWFSVYSTLVHKNNHEYAISTFADITNRKKTENDLYKLGVTDQLTGMYNRRYIFDRLNEILSDGAKSECSVAIIDIDKFKSVNDTYGHIVGDLVLKKLAKLAKEKLRSTDLIGRYGGEEFIIITPGSTLQDAKKILNRVNVYFAEAMESEVGKAITFSGGVTNLQLQDYKEKNIQQIVERADKLLYKAKENGRNRVEI